MLTCGDVGSDVHALIKELAIRRVQHRSETHSNESQHLAEGTEGARLRRRFSFVLQQALSFRTRYHLCRQRVALASTRQLRSQGPASVQAHRTGGVTGTNTVGCIRYHTPCGNILGLKNYHTGVVLCRGCGILCHPCDKVHSQDPTYRVCDNNGVW